MTASPPTWRTLLTLAWPIILARATQSVMGFGDALMTAHLGEESLAATATGGLNTFLITIVPTGMAFIIQSFSAQLTGRGDAAAARRYAWYGLGLAGLSGIAGLAAIPFLGPVIGAFQFAPGVAETMRLYLAIRLTSVLAMVGVEALGNWFAGTGDTQKQLYAATLSMVSDLCLNWVLIYGHLGAPALGVAGAALSSAIGSWLGFFYILASFLGTPGPRSALRALEFRRMVRFGLPNGVSWFFEFGAFMLFINGVMGYLGTIPLAAVNVQLQINSIAFMPAIGLASAGAVLVGQGVGASRKEQVGGIVRLTANFAMAWMGTAAVFYFIFPRWLMGFFAPRGGGAELIAVGAALLQVSAFWQIFDALGMVLSEALRAAGDTAWCLWARLVLAWVVFVPAAFVAVFVLRGGPTAAIFTVAGYMALLALAFLWRFRSGAWKSIDLTGLEEVPV